KSCTWVGLSSNCLKRFQSKGLLNYSIFIEVIDLRNTNKLITLTLITVFLLTINIVSCNSTLGTHHEQHIQVEIGNFVYSTFLGGDNPPDLSEDHVKDIITDSNDNIIVTGYTLSNNFPIKDAFQDTFAGGGKDIHGVGGDAFITKFDQNGQLIWSTFLGGSSMDGGLFVEVVEVDNIVVVGLTTSINFPTTEDAFQQDYSDNYDIFITKFSSNGSLLYSSYLGTTGNDRVNDCDLDSVGNLVISGGTSSSVFPVTSDAEQPVFGGSSDGFLMRLSANCTTIIYSTFLGGTSFEGIDKIAIDNNDNIVATGFTVSPDFPISVDAYQDAITGIHRDFFVAKYNSSGHLKYSTYFGGSHMDDCFGVTTDSGGNIILTGRTWSSDFPIMNAWQENYSDIEVDGFVTKLTSDGQELVFSSYFGGSAWDTVHHPSVDAKDNIIVSGIAGSDGLPIINGFQEAHGGSCDIIIMKISPTGQPLFGSYLGGTGLDHPWQQYLTDDNLYLVGSVNSSDFLISDNAFQPILKGTQDGFLFRFDIEGYLTALSTSTTTTNTSSSTTQSTSSFDLYVAFFALPLAVVTCMRNRQHRRK
ncbi:MAG: SBBP repeat-containing protein, partial [Candidatus Hodarchaeales archaeon]